MSIANFLEMVYGKWQESRHERFLVRQIASYVRNGRKPWSEGYIYFKDNFIAHALNESTILDCFSGLLPLPKKYGEFLDERVVEYPWFISRLGKESGRLLDAGSALNFPYIIMHPFMKHKDVTIVTLEPEDNCYWENGVSYFFGDIRDLPFRNDWFDEVVSISTLEHIGMNNAIYTENAQMREKKTGDYLKAVAELKRVTKPGGKVYITVPFGRYTDFGWYQQFNAEMIDALLDAFAPSKCIQTYFRYASGSWSFGDKGDLSQIEGFNIYDTKYFNPAGTRDYDPDYAACSRAIAALELWK